MVFEFRNMKLFQNMLVYNLRFTKYSYKYAQDHMRRDNL